MKPAARSLLWFDHAALARIALVLGAALIFAALSGPAHAEGTPPRQLVVLPSECAQYWVVPGGTNSPAGWNQALSFAACLQDATVARVDDAAELDGLVDQLQSVLDPALQIYITVVQEGPGPVKIRATLQIAMAEAALITRARASIAAPPDLRSNEAAAARFFALHDRLERLLEPQAAFACMLIRAVDRAVAEQPALAADASTQNLLAFARRVAAQLRKTWSIPEAHEVRGLIAAPAAEQGEHTWLNFMSSTRTWTPPTPGYSH